MYSRYTLEVYLIGINDRQNKEVRKKVESRVTFNFQVQITGYLMAEY